MAWINYKIWTISSKVHYPYEWIFGKASPGPEYIVKEVTGNGYINLTNAVANHLMELKAYGWTEQNWTPTPTTPIDIVSNNGVLKFSKNMANVNAQTALIWYYISSSWVVTAEANNRMYQDYIPCKPNTKYTLSMSQEAYFVTISEYVSASDSGFYRRNAGAFWWNTKLTIMTGANTNYLRFGTNIDGSEVTLERVLAINWQLEIWDTPTQYHEYVEWGVYVDWTTETIKIHGKNLFDKSGDITGKILNDSGSIMNESNGFYSANIPVSPNTTYTVSQNSVSGGIYLRVLEYNNVDTVVKLNKGTVAAVQDITFTTSATTKYVIISGISSGRDTLQLELGSTATEYEPYFNGGTATAEMLLKVGDYADEQEILSWDITRKIGIKVLDGTENDYAKRSDVAINYTGLTDRANGADILGICSHFVCTANNASTAPVGSLFFNVSNIYLHFFTEYGGDVASFKAWLAEQYNAWTPVIVVYTLATPTTESVAGQTMNIQTWSNMIEITQAGIDNLWLYAKYKATA